MISIVHADKATRDALLQRASFYEKIPECLIALNSEKQLGHILYCFDKDSILLLELRAVSSEVGDGLVRAALNAALTIGLHTVTCSCLEMLPNNCSLGFHRTERQGKIGFEAEIRSLLKCQCE